MRLSRLLLSLPLSLLLLPASTADESCKTECHTNKAPFCGIWLVADNNSQVAGTYELNNGIINMHCEFSSLPEPATVSWMHQKLGSDKWEPFACSTKDEQKLCSAQEHRVKSNCVLKTSELTMSGAYRCEGVNPSSTLGKDISNKAVGSEFNVQVSGISKIELTDQSLPYKKLGYLNVEVCSNPKPEIFWLANDAIITAHTANQRIVSTHLHHKHIRTSVSGSSSVVPFCYTSQLIIREVNSEDRFHLIVKIEGQTNITKLQTTVTNIPKSAFYAHFSLSSVLMFVVYLF